HHDLRGHTAQHLLIGMFAPHGTVLGAPLTLAIRVLPVRMARGLTRLLHSQPLPVLTHPFPALLFNIGAMYALYLTPLYSYSQNNSILHALVHLHFLIAGFIFTWSIIGLDPTPRRPR